MWNPFSRRIALDWVQIEVASTCNASCFYCPQTAYKAQWENRLLDPGLLDNILPHLHPKTYIHLQGWGEPFLHPRLLDMIATIKAQGFKVGTTSNASRLDESTMERLVDLGLDMLAFSTAGATPEENDAIRQGTSLEQVAHCIDTLQRIKRAKGSPFPRIHVAQMLLRSSLERLDSYPAFWKRLGADQVVLSSLSLVARPELREEARLADSLQEWDELKETLYALRRDNGLQNVLRFHLVSPFMLFKRCEENVTRAAVVGSDGGVAPCVMVNLPVSGPVEHWTLDGSAMRENIRLGDLNKQDFADIWKDRGYRGFRKQEELGHEQCAHCLKRSVETMETAYRIDPSSMTCRWQLIKEANEEREAVERMQEKRNGRQHNAETA